jgi:peptidoglycan hydrolase-like protein with peptidoglycan-binding domain
VATKQTTVDFPEERINGALEKPGQTGPSDAELDRWRSIKDSKNPEELRAYLTAYPNGRFRYPALARIAYLEGTATKREVAGGVDPETYTKQADQTSEDRIGLDRSQRREVQRRLTGLGFDTKADGKFSEDTRGVISRWQAARGYPITGYLNELQRKALLAETAAAPQTSDSSDDDGPPARASRHRRHSSKGDDDVGHLFGSVVAGMGGGGYGGSQPGNSKRSPPTAPDEPDVPPELGLPDFPWPPPAPSASYVLPDNLLAGRKTLQEATDAIVSALEHTGYVERSFYRTKPGGIALVTHLERIKSDGSPAEPDRWAAVAGNYSSSADLMNFLRGLFFAQTGHYRLIVFIMQDTPFIPSAQAMAEPAARALVRQGANVLPAETGKRPFAGNHCTALIYEFSSDGKNVEFLAESPLTGKEHLDKAGVLTLLAKPR